MMLHSCSTEQCYLHVIFALYALLCESNVLTTLRVKKDATLHSRITSAYVDQFSKFFHSAMNLQKNSCHVSHHNIILLVCYTIVFFVADVVGKWQKCFLSFAE